MFQNDSVQDDAMHQGKSDDTKFAGDLFAVKLLRHRRRIILTIVGVVLVAILLGSFWLAGHNAAKHADEAEFAELRAYIDTLENTPYVLDRVTPQIVQDVLLESVTEVGELVSAEYLFTNAARFTDTSNIIEILDWMTEKSFVQKWDGCIKAGVDLSRVQVVVKKGVITITLPEAKILSYEVDYDSVEIFNEMNNVFNPISVKDKNSFDKKTSEAMKKRAVKHGLLESAQKNAETIIRDLLYASIPEVSSYTIQFAVEVPQE